ncbi:NAD(P)-binding protein [Kribbella sp. NPDC000426]
MDEAIVVGAGIGGLAAAAALGQAGWRVRVLAAAG